MDVVVKKVFSQLKCSSTSGISIGVKGKVRSFNWPPSEQKLNAQIEYLSDQDNLCSSNLGVVVPPKVSIVCMNAFSWSQSSLKPVYSLALCFVVCE